MGINGKGSVLAFSSGLDQQRRGGFGLVSYNIICRNGL